MSQRYEVKIQEARDLFDCLLDGREHKTSVGNWQIIITDEDCIERIFNWLSYDEM